MPRVGKRWCGHSCRRADGLVGRWWIDWGVLLIGFVSNDLPISPFHFRIDEHLGKKKSKDSPHHMKLEDISHMTPCDPVWDMSAIHNSKSCHKSEDKHEPHHRYRLLDDFFSCS